MALDIYVMPLWRFKAGDFMSPIESALGIKPRVVTAEGIHELPRAVDKAKRLSCQQEVADICKRVEAVNKVRIKWKDEGDVQYASQCWGIQALRAYARWLDLRDRVNT